MTQTSTTYTPDLLAAAESAVVRLADFVDEDVNLLHCLECSATADLGDPDPLMRHAEGCALGALAAAIARAKGEQP